MSEPVDKLRRQGGRFVMVPAWVFDADVSDGAIRLYGVLADFADQEGRSWPSRRVLGERMRCSLDTVDRRVAELKDAGFLKSEPRATAQGDQTSNLWTLRTLAAVAAPMPRGGRTDAATGGRKSAALTRSNYEQEENARIDADSGPLEGAGSASSGSRNAREIRDEFEANLAADGGVAAPDDAAETIERARAVLASKRRHPTSLIPPPELVVDVSPLEDDP